MGRKERVVGGEEAQASAAQCRLVGLRSRGFRWRVFPRDVSSCGLPVRKKEESSRAPTTTSDRSRYSVLRYPLPNVALFRVTLIF